jgi:hypothetical protein
MIGNIALLLFALVLGKIGFLVIRFYYLSSKIPPIPELKTKLPVLKMFKGTRDAYDEFHYEFFDESDSPYPVVRGVLYINSSILTLSRVLASLENREYGFQIPKLSKKF